MATIVPEVIQMMTLGILLTPGISGCLSIQLITKTTCTAPYAVRAGPDEFYFTVKYNKTCSDVIAINAPVCFKMMLKHQCATRTTCENIWFPKEICTREEKFGCFRRDGDIYYLRHSVDKERWRIRALSGGNFEASVLKNADDFHREYHFNRQEKLPVIYDVETETITLNDERIALETARLTVLLGLYQVLEYCVTNVSAPVLSIVLDDVVTVSRPESHCVETRFMASLHHNSETVTLSYNETDGCMRELQRTIDIIIDISSELMPTTITPRPTRPNRPTRPSSSTLPYAKWCCLFFAFLFTVSPL